MSARERAQQPAMTPSPRRSSLLLAAAAAALIASTASGIPALASARPLTGATATTRSQRDGASVAPPPHGADATADPIAAERAALVDLYNAAGGAAWRHTENWMTSAPHCTWWGVTCSNVTGRITQFSQYDNGLKGTIPASMSALTEVEYFALSTNYLSGTLPPSLGSTFSNNMYMDLRYNMLTGSVAQLGAMTELTHLIVSNNQFSDGLSAALSGLSKLQYLDVSVNLFVEAVPTSLCAETNLTYCALDKPGHATNKFASVPPCIAKTTKCIV